MYTWPGSPRPVTPWRENKCGRENGLILSPRQYGTGTPPATDSHLSSSRGWTQCLRIETEGLRIPTKNIPFVFRNSYQGRNIRDSSSYFPIPFPFPSPVNPTTPRAAGTPVSSLLCLAPILLVCLFFFLHHQSSAGLTHGSETHKPQTFCIWRGWTKRKKKLARVYEKIGLHAMLGNSRRTRLDARKTTDPRPCSARSATVAVKKGGFVF